MNSLAEQIPSPTFRGVLTVLLTTSVAVLTGLLASKGLSSLLIWLPTILLLIAVSLRSPTAGLIVYINLSFMTNGASRFFPSPLPYGTLIDITLLLVLLGIWFSARPLNPGWIRHPIFYLVLAWFLYTMLLFFNPLSPSQEAFMYAIRGLSVYWMLATIIGFLAINQPKQLFYIIHVWLFWSFFAALWGYKQEYIGLSEVEQAWLDNGAAETHVLFGRLRVFSIYSDASQFGAEMATATLFALIMVIEEKRWFRRFLYLILVGVFFWAFAISGSRGPLFILFCGLPVYLLLRKNVFLLIVGSAIGIAAFGLLKFTYIGQSNYQIRRMRSALDPNDPSLQVRLNNQKLLMNYMSNKPFGGGIGSGGDWGHRFAPKSFLGQVALDSWFVKIWVETGIVGLVFHLTSLFIIGIIGFRNISRLRAGPFKSYLMALLACYAGIVVASYGNQIFGQHPTDSRLYICIVFFAVCHKIERLVDAGQAKSTPEPVTYAEAI